MLTPFCGDQSHWCEHGFCLVLLLIHSYIGLYPLKVDVGMLNTANIFLADISSVSSLLEKAVCSDEGLTLETSAN